MTLLAGIKRLIVRLQFWKRRKPSPSPLLSFSESLVRSVENGVISINEARRARGYGPYSILWHKHQFRLIPDFGLPVFVYSWKCKNCPETKTHYKHLSKKEMLNA